MYEIEYTQTALNDLKWFRKHEQKIIVQAIDIQLKHEPKSETRNRKPMRPNPMGEWELRVGNFRVLYDVFETVQIVEIERIGQKRGNKFFFRGKEEEGLTAMIEWDYRVFREEDGDYIIRETFYDEQGDIVSCTRGGVEPVGTSLEELAEQIDAFRKALSLPILTLEDVPKDDTKRAYEPKQDNVSHEQLMAELGLLPEPHTSTGLTADIDDAEAAWKANGWKQHDIFEKYPDGLDMFDEIEEEHARYRLGGDTDVRLVQT